MERRPSNKKPSKKLVSEVSLAKKRKIKLRKTACQNDKVTIRQVICCAYSIKRPNIKIYPSYYVFDTLIFGIQFRKKNS